MNSLGQKIHLQVSIYFKIDFFVGQVEDSKIPSFGKKFGGLHGMANSTTNFQRIQDPAVEFDLELTLEELYYGALKKIKISKKV
jgi:DnaJ-class molecular chaperone